MVGTVDNVVEESVCAVLGSMCFAAPEYQGPGQLQNQNVAAIRFSGEIHGELKIALEAELARQLTADFLGAAPEEVTCEQTTLFSLELANVLCGAVLAEISSGKHFQLGLPETAECSEAYPYCFSVAGSGIDLGLSLNMN